MLVFIAITQKLAQALLVKYNGVDYEEVKQTSSDYTVNINGVFPRNLYLYVKQVATVSYDTASEISCYNNSIELLKDTSTFNPSSVPVEITKNFELTQKGVFTLNLKKYTVPRTYTIIIKQSKTINKNYNGLPRSLKLIGDKSTITLFGVHIDGSRVTQETE